MSPFFFVCAIYISMLHLSQEDYFHSQGEKMKLVTLITLLVLSVSCGRSHNAGSIAEIPAAPELPTEIINASIFNQFQSVDGEGLHGINSFNLAGGELNVQSDVLALESLCDGSYGNVGDVNGAQPSRITFTGDATNGILQIGNTKYVGASNPVCRELSKESYTYTMSEQTLTLCMVNYPFCADYTVVE